jgi:uncharacterized protein (TIGR00303 family)
MKRIKTASDAPWERPLDLSTSATIGIYTEHETARVWLERYRGVRPVLACILGFTETALIPGISAAGATPDDRRYTAIADAEFLYHGPQASPQYPLPPLDAGASPVLISRAAIAGLGIPLEIFDAGLAQKASVPTVDLGGRPARCLSTGAALDLATVKHLFDRGLEWGDRLVSRHGYAIVAECVVGGTTTALGILSGLGLAAAGKVNSSHPQCNHAQKLALVERGLQHLHGIDDLDPMQLLAAVGDPMQGVAAGMAIAASRRGGVLLAGGTQMLAVYALARAIARRYALDWRPEQVVVGTTRWVAEDPSGDTVGLAEVVGEVPLLASQLSFARSRHPQLRAYERGYVKEGVGAGGCAIAAHLYGDWTQNQLLAAIEALGDRDRHLRT